MTQHIIVEDVLEDGTVIVNRDRASVWRDDQVVMWSLAPHLTWPDVTVVPTPIVFDEYWPGHPPAPIGNTPVDCPDQRNYIAFCCKVLPHGAQPEVYSYQITALRITGAADHATPTWTDPDIGNQPQP